MVAVRPNLCGTRWTELLRHVVYINTLDSLYKEKNIMAKGPF